jgi:hypothetical protein
MDRRKVSLLVVASVLVTAFATAAPVLHEYFDVDGVAPPQRAAGASSSSTTGNARPSEAAASGLSTDAKASTDSAEKSRAQADSASHQALAAVSDPDRYRLDANTSRPDNVNYSDPFTPAIPPFKRMYAFDAVNAQLELVVADPGLAALRVGGRVAAGDDQFMGDISLQLSAGDLVRVPSVGPGARIIGFRLEPPADATLLSDSAENWFIRSPEAGARRLHIHLAIDHAVFGSHFKPVSWEALSKALPPRPNAVFDSAEAVLRRIGVSQQKAPAQALAGLVEYFREFAPSDEELSEKGAALYERIALGQKGVCRHRAFAFVVTALALGLPSRFVHNEAHAWVEVFDTELWHRIDLGGAAGHAGLEEPLSMQHVAPNDPFPWPPRSERGTDMLPRNAGGSAGAGDSTAAPSATDEQGPESAPSTPSTPTAPSDAPSTAAPDQTGSSPSTGPSASVGPSAASPSINPNSAPTTGGEPSPSATSEELVPGGALQLQSVPGEVTFTLSTRDVTRGARIALNGKVSAEAADCSMRRINVVLRGEHQEIVPVGALFTDAQGRFSGEIVVSDAVPVGDYDVQVVLGENCSRRAHDPR